MDRAEILVIEDDPDTARLFVDVLGDAGFVALGCPQEALPAGHGFSVVLTDLGPGRRSTEQAREWIRGLRLRYRAPVIVVTGLAFSDGELSSVAADVMSKPIDIDDFVRRVSAVLPKGETAA